MHRSILAPALAALALLAAPSGGEAAVSAKPRIATGAGGTRLVVTVARKHAFTRRNRPRAVSVVAGAKRYELRRGLSAAARSVWSTRARHGAPAAALRTLAGRRVAIEIKTRAGTRTLRRRVGPLPPVTTPTPGPGKDPTPGAPTGQQVLECAQRYLGTPYHWGGATPATGFDPGGLPQYCYGQAGISIPRTPDQQILVGAEVAAEALEAGDLVFFRDGNGYVDHVGVYSGDRRFIHPPHTGDVIKYDSLDEPYYQARFTGARRYFSAAGQMIR